MGAAPFRRVELAEEPPSFSQTRKENPRGAKESKKAYSARILGLMRQP